MILFRVPKNLPNRAKALISPNNLEPTNATRLLIVRHTLIDGRDQCILQPLFSS